MLICVDPGHGMGNRRPNISDPGAVWDEAGVRFEEAAIVLQYGLALRDALRAAGHEVFMTRDDAQDPCPVAQRAGNAEKVGAKLLISLHLNSAANPDGSVNDTAHGVETLFRDEPDRALAVALNNAVVQATGLRDRGPKQRDGLAVLSFKGPAALIELGFIPNDRDREALLNPATRHNVCKAITAAVAKVFPG